MLPVCLFPVAFAPLTARTGRGSQAIYLKIRLTTRWLGEFNFESGLLLVQYFLGSLSKFFDVGLFHTFVAANHVRQLSDA